MTLIHTKYKLTRIGVVSAIALSGLFGWWGQRMKEGHTLDSESPSPRASAVVDTLQFALPGRMAEMPARPELFSMDLPASQSTAPGTPEILERKRIVDGGDLLKEVRVISGEDGFPIREEDLLEPASGKLLKRVRMVADRLVVGFDPSKGSRLQEAYLKNGGLKVSDVNNRLGLMRVSLPSASIRDYDKQKAAFIDHPDLFTFAESEYLQDHASLPNDPYLASSGSWGQSFQDTWGLHRTGVVDVWDATSNLPAVVVAVIDSGVDLTHPELVGKIWQNSAEIPGNGLDDDGNGKIDDVNGWNFVDKNTNVTDVHGHGTEVAGVIAAVRNNANGIAGVAPNAKLMIMKTSNFGFSSSYDNASAVEYAVDKGARVINMSFGNSDISYALDMAIGYARTADVVLVAAAGNEGQLNANIFPANFDGVISVGSFGPDGRRSAFSNYGPLVDLMAPGDGILALWASGTLRSGQQIGTQLVVSEGTSLAAPFVAGLASIIRGRHPEFTAAEVQARLKESPIELGTPGWDLETGQGGVSAAPVLSDLPPVVADVTTPGNSRVIVGTVPVRGMLASDGTLLATLSISSASGAPIWTEVGTTSSKGVDVLLGSLPTESFPDGPYVLRLNAKSGGTTVDDYQVITIGNGLPTTTKVNGEAGSNKAAADLNGDGTLEVLNADFRSLAVYNGGSGVSLPGWPQTALFSNYGHNYGVPALADLDGNGTKEIGLFFAPTNNQWGDSVLEIFHVDGSRAAGWPRSFHNGRTTNPRTISPVFADMDGDGVSEIIYVQSDDSHAIVQVVNLDGTSVPGWPVTLPAGSVTSDATPAVADMDGDGRMDLSVLCEDGNIYLLHHDGSSFVNWPMRHSFVPFYTGHLVLADFDNDGSLEIFAISNEGKACIYESQGSIVPGWPRTFSGELGVPAIGNVYGDNALEIVVGIGNDQHVWTANGANAPGWPQRTISTLGMPILVDLDNDGDVDIYNTSYGQQLLAWDSTGRSLSELGFPRSTRYFGETQDLAGDLDGDGFLEITADKHDQGSHYLRLKTPASGQLEHGEIHMLPDRSNRHAVARLNPIEGQVVLAKSNAVDRLTLTGKGFLLGTQVTLGDQQLIVESMTVETLVCMLPAAVPTGAWTCKVQNPNFGSLILPRKVLVTTTPGGDDDEDGLTNLEEIGTYGTDSANPDTDGDGLTDGQEVQDTHTNPKLADTDGDGLADGQEIQTTHTDPKLADTDGDGLTDGQEIQTTHTDPNLADSNGNLVSDANEDPDGDDLTNLEELGSYGTDPNLSDTDGDGLTDGQEIQSTHTNPKLADTDGDGLIDDQEIQITHTDPNLADTDGDGLTDGREVQSTHTDPNLTDTDGDSLTDGQEIQSTQTNPTNPDTDGDGLTDGQEVQTTYTDPNLADSNGNLVSDANEDPDGDSLTNLEELTRFHTNPLLTDSNSDGLSDTYAAAFVGAAIKPSVGNQIALNLRNLVAEGYTFKLIGKLPAGLTFNATTGLISGIVTGAAGNYPLSVQILSGRTVVKTISLPIVVLAFPASLLGTFESIVENESSVPVGAFKLTITGADAWTATLDSVGGATRKAKGKFILTQGAPIAPITAAFVANGSAPAMTMSVSLDGTLPTFSGSWNGGTLRGFKLAFGPEYPDSTTLSNLVLDPGMQNGESVPAGFGTLKGTFSNLGTGKFKGILGDGTSATISVGLSTTGQAVIWSQAYSNKDSYLGGIISINGVGRPANTTSKLPDLVYWRKAADSRTASYPNGFSPLRVTVGSSSWSAPASPSILGASLGWRDNRLTAVTLSGGGISNSAPQNTSVLLPTEFALDGSFNLVATLPTGSLLVAWTGKVTKADGGFSGAFTLPAGFSAQVPGGSAAVNGVLVQDPVWGAVTGLGLVKVPVADARGSFKTAAFKLGQ